MIMPCCSFLFKKKGPSRQQLKYQENFSLGNKIGEGGFGYVYKYFTCSCQLLGKGYSNIQFTWRIRTKISIGVARGLAFLHEEVQPHIIHRDIKASNVLLDKDLTPKISDFGLARLLPSNMTHISTRVAGTM
ncbi:hypothetical protein BHE74_00004972 [Ensete ventricosum]|nr:hypothetical protein GW17_00003872 [Ensete ventricosum]RWW86259.1 hypothetical protein BHE74_00004972 [Ensete ventricosum]